MLCRRDTDEQKERDYKHGWKYAAKGLLTSLISGSGDFNKLDFIQLNSIKHFPKVRQLRTNYPALISALGLLGRRA